MTYYQRPSQGTSIFAIRTTIGQEKGVAHLLTKRMETMKLKTLKSILVPEQLKGYVFVEAGAAEEVGQACMGIPHIRGKPIGTIALNQIEHFLIPRVPTEGLAVGDLIEIIGGPFKGEKAKVTRIDTTKEEVTLELLESTYPIPIKVHADYIKLIEKGDRED
ncbi:MAG: transcription elongation factor Spt5 [Candidatus Helarchaeota archaeon]|nr:transcription elongation factor Spt5 [Candidatus Helarchaeota archaeon]